MKCEIKGEEAFVWMSKAYAHSADESAGDACEDGDKRTLLAKRVEARCWIISSDIERRVKDSKSTVSGTPGSSRPQPKPLKFAQPTLASGLILHTCNLRVLGVHANYPCRSARSPTPAHPKSSGDKPGPEPTILAWWFSVLTTFTPTSTTSVTST